MNDRTENPLLQTSSLYREFLAERQEILRFREEKSEEVGYDVGFEYALLHWCRHYRDAWRAKRQAERELAACACEPVAVAD